jgi:Protein of unknown function (DUF1702)
LSGAKPDRVARAAAAFPWDRRAFFHEGHAMGSVGRAALSFRSSPEAAFAVRDFPFLRSFGHGLWDGVAAAFRLPRIAEDAPFWDAAPESERYRPVRADGRGFAAVLFTGRWSPEVRERLAAPQTDARRRQAALLGAGRALWYLHLGDGPPLAAALAESPALAEPLAVGVGFAMAFTQVAEPARIQRCIDRLPARYRPDLRRGAGIALQVHAAGEPAGRAEVERRLEGAPRAWYEAACRAALRAGGGADWYGRYVDGASAELPFYGDSACGSWTPR